MKCSKYLKKALLINLVFLSLSTLPGLNPAQATTSGALGVQPTNPDPTQPSGKSWFIYTTEIGQEIKDWVDVINLADEPVKVRVWGADATTAPDGAYTIKEVETDIGTWIAFPIKQGPKTELKEERILDLKARETKTIDFILKVPENVEVGDHMGAIMAQAIGMQKEIEEGNAEVEAVVKIVTRVGARVYLTIPGKIVRILEFPNFSWEKRDNLLYFVLTLKNLGNVRIEPKGGIIIKNILGTEIGEVEVPTRVIFPKDGIVLPVKWGKTPSFSRFTARASVTYGTGETLTRELAFWVFPPRTTLLGISLGIILVVSFWVKRKRRRKKRSHRLR